MKYALTILSFVFTLLTAPMVTMAYEGDTHGDVTYHQARASGLSDGTAKFFALASKFIDQNLISSPMLLSVQRQLAHFPGDIDKLQIEGHGAISLPSRIFKSKLALAERNSAIGNYLIAEGLRKGDLLLVALGIHIKQDTYGHAGHSNLLGHMADGHNPDRAFLETKKYEDMTRSIVQTLIAVKQLMPDSSEFKDEASALKYLNKFASRSHLGRDLTIEDMQNATLVSGVMLEDMEFQSIYREDMFRKYEYKKIALEQVFEKFKNNGIIYHDITFEQLFPEELLRDPRMTTKDVIKYVIVTTTDAAFMKTEGGIDIFDIRKLFGIRSEDIFLRKVQVEVDRADFRLRAYFHHEAQLKKLMFEKEVDLSDWEDLLNQFHAENKAARRDGKAPTEADDLKFLASKFGMSKKELREIYYLKQRNDSEREELIENGFGPSFQFEMGSEEFIKMRAQEFAELRFAEEIAIKLTKDLIPNERTEYLKQNFEGDTPNRQFETAYKAEAYRLFRMKNWGVNFTMDDGPKLFTRIKELGARFKDLILRRATAELQNKWNVLAQETARQYMEIDQRIADPEFAENIGFNSALRTKALKRLTAYIGPAAMPWFFGQISGYKYLQKIIKKAKLFAKDHEVEDMKEAAKSGKYAEDLAAGKKNKAVVDFIRSLNRPADENIMRFRPGTLSCKTAHSAS